MKEPARAGESLGGGAREQLFLARWSVPAGILTLIYAHHHYQEAKRANEEAKRANEEAFKNSDEYKIQKAVKKFMEEQPSVPQEVANREVVTDLVERLRHRIQNWGTQDGASGDEKHFGQHATVLSGLFEAGKSTAVRQALAGVRGVLQVSLRGEEKCEATIFNALGVTGEVMFTEVIRRVATELRSVTPAASGAVTQVPVVVLDIPRHSKVDIETVSTFAKSFSTDMRGDYRVHVLAMASSASAAAGFDAGGPGRRYDLWLEFSNEEAKELLKIRHGVQKPETAAKLVKLVGTNPGRLEAAGLKEMANAIEEGKGDDGVLAAVSPKYRKRIESEVRELLAMTALAGDEQRCAVGREMLQELMKSDSVSHARWQEKEIPLFSVAHKIKERGSHAVCYHMEKEDWRFVSRLHRDEAQTQLKKQLKKH